MKHKTAPERSDFCKCTDSSIGIEQVNGMFASEKQNSPISLIKIPIFE